LETALYVSHEKEAAIGAAGRLHRPISSVSFGNDQQCTLFFFLIRDILLLDICLS
jgi:hypothetical protein